MNKQNSSLATIQNSIEKTSFDQLLKESRFVQRTPNKLSGKNFLLFFLLSIWNNASCLHDVAMLNGIFLKESISKQAIFKRINYLFVSLLELVFNDMLLQQIEFTPDWLANHPVLKKFKRILVEDSSTISVAQRLFHIFPGSSNKFGQYATAKIQLTFDLLKEQMSRCRLTNFRENDQKASRDIIGFIQAGDLIVRDLGYFVLTIFEEIANKDAFFLSRFRSGVDIFDPVTEKKINLVKYLKISRPCGIDCKVLVGAKEKIPVRLIAQPVPQDVAAERRRNARNNRDQRLNHSEEYFFLLGWNIFITNCPEDMLAYKHAWEIYRLRWRIVPHSAG